MSNSGAYHYQNRSKTNEEQRAWDAFDAAFDLAEDHFNEPIRKVEMNTATRMRIFGEDCEFIWGADVVVNEVLLDNNVVFDVTDPKSADRDSWYS